MIFGEELINGALHVSLFPLILALPEVCVRVTLTLPASLHADGARSSFSSSEGSWAAIIRLAKGVVGRFTCTTCEKKRWFGEV